MCYNRVHKIKERVLYSDEVRQQAVTLYASWGSGYKVSNALGVDRSTIKKWMREPWWEEKLRELKTEQRAVLTEKLDNVIDKSLEVTLDRLTNGEKVLNNKTGELVTKPVALRDAAAVANGLLQRKSILEKQDLEETVTNIPMKETLAMLATEFAKWARNQTGKQEAIDVEVINVTSEEN
jgi:transposase-like protein